MRSLASPTDGRAGGGLAGAPDDELRSAEGAQAVLVGGGGAQSLRERKSPLDYAANAHLGAGSIGEAHRRSSKARDLRGTTRPTTPGGPTASAGSVKAEDIDQSLTSRIRRLNSTTRPRVATRAALQKRRAPRGRAPLLMRRTTGCGIFGRAMPPARTRHRANGHRETDFWKNDVARRDTRATSGAPNRSPAPRGLLNWTARQINPVKNDASV